MGGRVEPGGWRGVEAHSDLQKGCVRGMRRAAASAGTEGEAACCIWIRVRREMGHHKWMDASQGNTMEQYTTPMVVPQRGARLEVSGDAVGTPLNTDKPSRAELLVAIQGSRVALEGKIESVVVEVNQLQADLLKVSDKVKVAAGAEGSIAELQTEFGTLRKQMEVWRWLEMWDKVAPGRTEGSGGVTRRASGAESMDWRSHGTGRLVDLRHRVEIQQDGTMAVGRTALDQEFGAGVGSGMT
ncbi:hypothetical protein NDU88_001100 [Pleurodeles waltl]|uniref:Uncharacterized protein n=1 Tax=Pleurodeles waltl TaxID=8319 RepID=A0AAV7NCI7_PLEWA|nr:hypothetical protein NDU88_001100 [Pleurodeles waltl]